MGLCQMIDHIHLLCYARSLSDMSRFISAYTSRFVKEFNSRIGRTGKLFVKEYGSAIKKESKRIRSAIRYCTSRLQKSVRIVKEAFKNGKYLNYRLIDTTLEGYWSNHACLGGTETWGNGRMKQRQMDVIIINAVIPLLYIYGKHRGDTAACDKAEELLHQLKSEENSIVRKWKDKGIAIECAADSQAILQLDRRYCRLHNCTRCRFAYYYLKDRIASC